MIVNRSVRDDAKGLAGKKSVSDLWRGMTSRKSHVSELKNWMPKHSQKKKKKRKKEEIAQASSLIKGVLPGLLTTNIN